MSQSATQTKDYTNAVQRGFEIWRETTDRSINSWWSLAQRYQSAQFDLVTGALRRAGEAPTLLLSGAAQQLRYAAAMQTPATESSLAELRNELNELSRRVDDSASQTNEKLGSLEPIEQQVTQLAALNGFLPPRLTAIEGQVAALGHLGERISALQEQLRQANLDQIGEVGARIEQLDLVGLRRDLDERLGRLEAAVASSTHPTSPQPAQTEAKAPARSAKSTGGKG